MNRILFLSLCCALLATACKKDVRLLTKKYDVGLPDVQTVSTNWHGDTLLVTCNVRSSGKTALSFLGLCYNVGAVPTLTDHQTLVDQYASNGDYVVALTGFAPYDTVYLRAIAGNDQGYAYGNLLKATAPYPGPPSVPCTVSQNVIGIFTTGSNSTNSTVNYVSTPPFPSFGQYEVDAETTGGYVLQFYFNHVPGNGIYTTGTESSFESSSNGVFVEDNNGSGVDVINPGGKIYVTENGNGSYNIHFCDLTETAYSFHFKGNVLVN